MTSMTNLFGNVSIGQDTSGNIKLSLNGLAIKGPSGYVRFEDGSVVDVPDELIIDGSENFIYRFPVSAGKVDTGDLIITNDDPFHAVFAREAGHAQGQLNVYDPFYETISVYSPRRNIFNLVFFVKAFSLVEELGIGTLGGEEFDEETLRLLPFLSGSGQSSNIWTTLALMRTLRGRSRGRLLGRENLLLLPLLASQGGSAESLQTLLLMQALQEEEEEEEHGERGERGEREGRREQEARREDEGRREQEARHEDEGRREDEGRGGHGGRPEDEGRQPGQRGRPAGRQ